MPRPGRDDEGILMGLDDKIKNKAEDLTGKAKEGTGKATDDEQPRGRGQGRPGLRRHQAGRRKGQGRLQALRPLSLSGQTTPRGTPTRAVGVPFGISWLFHRWLSRRASAVSPRVSVADGRLPPWQFTSTSQSGPTPWPTAWRRCWRARWRIRSPARSWSCPRAGVERWLTQRLSHRLGVGPRAGDGVCAGRRLRDAALPRLDAARQGRRRPVGSRAARLAAARGHRLGDGRAGFRRPHHAPRRRRPDRRSLDPALRRRATTGGAVQLLRHPATGPDQRLARGARHRRRGRRARGRPALAGVAVAPAARPDGRRRRRTCGWRRRSSGCAAAAPISTCRRGSRCSATRGCPRPRSRSSTRSAPCATSTSGCRRPPRRCGARCPPTRRVRCRAPLDDSADLVGHPAPRFAGARLARAAAHARRRTHRRDAGAATPPPDTLLGLVAVRPARQRRARRRPCGLRTARRRLGAGPRLPRLGPPDRRAARGAGRAARRRPDARAARHPGDVSRHREPTRR